MVLITSKEMLIICTSLDTCKGGDLYPCWMLLNVRSVPYLVIYIVPQKLFFCVQGIFYGFQLRMSGADAYVAKVRQQQLLQRKDKTLHSEFLRKVDSGSALSLSFQWLMYVQLKIPTKAQVVAAQDQALTIKAIQNCNM